MIIANIIISVIVIIAIIRINVIIIVIGSIGSVAIVCYCMLLCVIVMVRINTSSDPVASCLDLPCSSAAPRPSDVRV